MFLSPEELQVLTGYARWADQRKWFASRRWIFEVNASGRPIVLKSYVEARLGLPQLQTRAFAPNFESLSKSI